MTSSRPHDGYEAGLKTMEALAQVRALYQAGRYAEAEAEARAVAAAQSRPHDEPFAPMALGIVGLAASAQGRHAEALTTYDALLPDYDKLFGAEHSVTLKLRTDRAHVLNMLGRHEECEAECVAVMETAALTETPETPFLVIAALNGQITALNARGDHPAAEGLAREFLSVHSEPDQFTLLVRLSLALSLNGQNRHEEALAEAKRADEIHRGLPPEHRGPETAAPDLAAATALHGLGHDTAARTLATTAYDACLTAFGPDNIRTTQARTLIDRIDGIDGIDGT
ncbi:tetratricopeptide repeat protein [Streptomyces wedmorensis]